MAKLKPEVAKISKKRPLKNAVIKSAKKATGGGHWSAGLVSSMTDPNLKVSEDELVVVIKDKFAKAKVHYLVLPKEDVTSLKTVNKEHLDLLKHMSKVGKKIAKQHPERTFKIGYHAEASMSRLHLHVISDDLVSMRMKTKKHWNSFASEFFIPHTDVIEDLEKNDRVTPKSASECKRLLGLPLKCHKCDNTAPTMPQLNAHVATHSKD